MNGEKLLLITFDQFIDSYRLRAGFRRVLTALAEKSKNKIHLIKIFSHHNLSKYVQHNI